MEKVVFDIPGGPLPPMSNERPDGGTTPVPEQSVQALVDSMGPELVDLEFDPVPPVAEAKVEPVPAVPAAVPPTSSCSKGICIPFPAMPVQAAGTTAAEKIKLIMAALEELAGTLAGLDASAEQRVRTAMARLADCETKLAAIKSIIT
jgi:hypothetical protein